MPRRVLKRSVEQVIATRAIPPHTLIVPSGDYHVISSIVHLLGCSILAFCFSRRLTWKHLTLSKICTIAIFLDSWLFVFSGGLVVTGIGMSLNPRACLTGIYLCISFYASSKVFIYIFLADRVYIVWSANNPVSRRKSKIWMLCGVVLLGYVVIFVLMLIAKIAYIRPDGTCVIGLGGIASIPLLTYDFFLNIFLTTLFVWPIFRRKLSNPKLRDLAKRTSFAATVALGTSVVNILVLTILHGQQLGWVCLASCGFDVTVNAMAICSITQNTHNTSHSVPQPSPAMQQATSPSSDNASRHDNSSESSRQQETGSSRKCRLPSLRGLSPPCLFTFACRNEDKSALPLHHPRRHAARFDTQSDDAAGAMTKREPILSSGDNGRKGTVDVRRISREESISTMILKVSSPSDQGCTGRNASSKPECGMGLKFPDQVALRCSDASWRCGQVRRASQNVAQVIPILRDTTSFNSSTSTNEFEATGTKIEFRSPLDVVDEDQPARVSEDLAVGAIAPSPLHGHYGQWR
ncbi:hypothetical protein CPB86DRAFT_802454 [Serendipita vermifera]|nr:hypothetical protein CPB86DRAFT_802454 [Serendipita vermifera]